jgi:hypothetical protein
LSFGVDRDPEFHSSISTGFYGEFKRKCARTAGHFPL